jgi:hypothetical protein
VGSRLLSSFRPVGLQANSLQIGMDWRVFAFTCAVTLLTALLFGVAPALRASLGGLSEALQSGGGRGGTATFTRNPVRSALVVVQVALAMVALAGAGLFVRSMNHAERTDPRFEARNLFTFNFDIGFQRFNPERGGEFFRAVLDRAKSVPGVHSAAVASNRPLGGGIMATLVAEGREDAAQGLLTNVNAVSPAFFETMRIPVVAGRGLTAYDRPDRHG